MKGNLSLSSHTTPREQDEETVRAFYSDVLSAPADTTDERYYELFSPAVVSIPT